VGVKSKKRSGSGLFIKRIAKPVHRFISTEVAGSIVLLIATLAALIWANLYQKSYYDFWSQAIELEFFGLRFSLPMEAWINDGLMSIFFLVVGLEIKRELRFGELSSIKVATLPIVSAIGGMMVPAGLFLVTAKLSSHYLGADYSLIGKGWAIPMATDIAFVLGVLSLLGKRVPVSLKLFLMSLAIVDDLGAILVIAVSYTSHLDAVWLRYAGLIWVGLLVGNIFKVRSLWRYLILGVGLWYAVFQSGIHATIAGVLLAITIPTRRKGFFNEKLAQFNSYLRLNDPSFRLLERLQPWVSFGVMPLFALANAGIVVDSAGVAGLFASVGLPIFFGLLLGKPLGIVGFAWLSLKFRLTELPKGVRLSHIIGGGILGGIGFTMAIFISLLAFENDLLVQQSKLAILIASVASALFGSLWLSRLSKTKKKRALPST